jgi:nucleoside-diphosphate-sugar epimerase
VFAAVTGASGHLGANLMRALISRDWKVRALVLGTGRQALLSTKELRRLSKTNDVEYWFREVYCYGNAADSSSSY